MKRNILRRVVYHYRTLLGALVLAGLICSLVLLPGVHVAAKGPVAPERQIGGQTVIVEPGAVVSWQAQAAEGRPPYACPGAARSPG
jgi:hypothetical protein